MKRLAIEGDILEKTITSLKKTEPFKEISEKNLDALAKRGLLRQCLQGEEIVKIGEKSTSFSISLDHELGVYAVHQASGELVQIGTILPHSVFGEIGLLLDQPRSATVRALTDDTLVLTFDKMVFSYLYENTPTFGMAVSRTLAARLTQVAKSIPLPLYTEDLRPTPDVLQMLPIDFIIRHRVLPLRIDGNDFKIGFVNDPDTKILTALHRFFPGMSISPVYVDYELFDTILQGQSGMAERYPAETVPTAAAKPEAGKSPELDALLRRLVAEGGSDLHLTANHKPHWRIDGNMMAIKDAPEIGSDHLLQLVQPIMDDMAKTDFFETADADFAYSLAEVGRFRVNVFRDENGVGAVFRAIPSQVLTVEQLGLPKIIKNLCNHPKGLVLVTGPTGSGKSTTLAAMVDHINKTRACHIITMEDPIEFLHKSDKSLINQRQVGRHTKNYAKALRAALREDPDVVLVGEMRDMETIALALELANTGHLVFATLHTSTAISTVNRIIDVFPPDQQSQIRTGLCDSLKGVIAQTLCKRKDRGRVAALEILVVNQAAANLIREQKTHQLLSTMQTGKAFGNVLMNDELAKLVKQGKVEYTEALSKTIDKEGLARLLGMALPTDA